MTRLSPSAKVHSPPDSFEKENPEGKGKFTEQTALYIN